MNWLDHKCKQLKWVSTIEGLGLASEELRQMERARIGASAPLFKKDSVEVVQAFHQNANPSMQWASSAGMMNGILLSSLSQRLRLLLLGCKETNAFVDVFSVLYII